MCKQIKLVYTIYFIKYRTTCLTCSRLSNPLEQQLIFVLAYNMSQHGSKKDYLLKRQKIK